MAPAIGINFFDMGIVFMIFEGVEADSDVKT